MAERTMSTRLATPDDAGEVARLLHDFNTEFDTASPGAEVLAGRLRRLLAGDDTLAIVAGDPEAAPAGDPDRAPAVAVALVTLRPNVWYDGAVALLDEMYVVPRLRGRGIGSAVVEHLLALARERGIDLVEINVDEADVDAQRFYEQHGFSGIEPDTGERAFYFHQELST